jgi:prepilin-type N-terminal cleavage/methylation domain-containing protein
VRNPFARTAEPRARGGFTLIELLISLAVTAMIILMVAQLMNSATAVTRTGNKHVDADTEARTVLDRMAVDFGKMLKRSDIDYWMKQQGARYYPGHSFGHSNGNGHRPASGQQGSDQIAFYSQVPGYYPSAGSQSPVSLVAYRVNADPTSPAYMQLERMGKGLLWNEVLGSHMVFLPLTIDQTWLAATNGTSVDSNYETIGPNVFRFEYYYLLKNGQVTDNPWDTSLTPPHTSIDGLKDIQAIAVAIAVVDPRSRSLLSNQNLIDLVSNMIDFRNAPGRSWRAPGQRFAGDLEYQWGQVVNGNTALVPPAANQAIRIYGRFFNLNLP